MTGFRSYSESKHFQFRCFLLTIILFTARETEPFPNGIGNFPSEMEHESFADEVDRSDDLFVPELYMTILNSEVQTPPFTHHLDLEIRSFDPADGFLEIYSGNRMLKRILDPPPSDVFSVYISSHSCPQGAGVCSDSYTAKLFSFKSQEPLVTSTVEYQIKASERPKDPPALAPGSTEPRPHSSQRQALPAETARSAWPLPCEHVVPFPGFPFASAFARRPIIFHAYPPHGIPREERTGKTRLTPRPCRPRLDALRPGRRAQVRPAVSLAGGALLPRGRRRRHLQLRALPGPLRRRRPASAQAAAPDLPAPVHGEHRRPVRRRLPGGHGRRRHVSALLARSPPLRAGQPVPLRPRALAAARRACHVRHLALRAGAGPVPAAANAAHAGARRAARGEAV